MSRDPEFDDRLTREVRLFIRETKDGCVDCLASKGGTCYEHAKLFHDLVLHPRKYIQIKAKKKGTN